MGILPAENVTLSKNTTTKYLWVQHGRAIYPVGDLAREGRNMMEEQIIIFMRAPQPGQVKTRLAKGVGKSRALAVYRQLVLHMVQAVRGSGLPWEICFCPPEGRGMIREWLGEEPLLYPQCEGDLGRRMAAAFSRVFDRGVDRVVLVGTDIPTAHSGHFRKALDCLREKDAVMGPTLDGGYWLVGFRAGAFDPRVFGGIDWGTPGVASQTRQRLKGLGLTHGELSPLRDIDTLGDLLAHGAETGEAFAETEEPSPDQER